jgi:hypothetical protein
MHRAVPWLRRLVTGLSLRRPGFDPGPVHVGFVVDKMAVGQVFPQVIRFSPVSFFPPLLHYLEKWKNLIIFIFITGLRLRCVRSFCCGVLQKNVQPESSRKTQNGPCHGSDGQSPASHCGGPGSIPGQSMWDLWWTKWQWDRFFLKYFGFPLSVSFHSSIQLLWKMKKSDHLYHRVAQ